jgi:pyridoxine 5-phosphate synthase
MNPLAPGAQAHHQGITSLSVNVNAVAHLRNRRPLAMPSVTRAATLCLQAGAQGITVHPRPDERHIRNTDVDELAELLKSHPGAEFNIEGNPFHNLMPILRRVRPHQATLVPDAHEQATSDHGWNVARDGERLAPIVAELRDLGIRVSLFMDPNPADMPSVASLGAHRIELYTEAYARSHGSAQQPHVLASYAATARAAQAVGLGVNAGHDLNRDNLPAFLQAVPGVAEVSIGHAFMADALELGYEATVRAYLRSMRLG